MLKIHNNDIIIHNFSNNNNYLCLILKLYFCILILNL